MLKRQSVPSYKTFQLWIKLKGFDESLRMNVFTLHADGCIVCLLCSKHSIAATTSQGKTANIDSKIPARPQSPSRLDKHLSSDQHLQAVKLEENQHSSTFRATYQDHIANKLNTVAEHVHLIYWILKKWQIEKLLHCKLW